jgi:hypothetical protein
MVAAAFLAGVATYYHRHTGFTAFVNFAADRHDLELAPVRAAPHYHDPGSTGYDGQFYAQMAVDPLLRDPAIDQVLDLAPYRARRILSSWTAYALGLGRPAWILQAYSLQNVAVWLILAWLLCRWMPPTSARGFVLWSGCLLSHGMLATVRYAVPDGLSVLLIALGVLAAERERPILSAIVIGVAGLARETSLIAASLFARFLRPSLRAWALVGGCLAICVLPFALWLDYLRSIYRGLTLVSDVHLATTPLAGIRWKFTTAFSMASLTQPTHAVPAMLTALALAAMVVQGGYTLSVLLRKDGRVPWALVGGSYVALALVMHQSVWEGDPGAFTRVLLPLTVGTNVLLARRPNTPWPLIVLANLGVVPGVLFFFFRML